MSESQVSIGQVKKDISELVNRVAYRGERILLTSRGKPKAVIISVEDYERLKGQTESESEVRWRAWQAESAELNALILKERGGQLIDVDALLEEAREEREARDAFISGD